MISISIISPLKSMAVIDKAIEHNDFGCVFHRYVAKYILTRKIWKKLKTYTNSVRTSPMCCFSPGNLVTPIF